MENKNKYTYFVTFTSPSLYSDIYSMTISIDRIISKADDIDFLKLAILKELEEDVRKAGKTIDFYSFLVLDFFYLPKEVDERDEYEYKYLVTFSERSKENITQKFYTVIVPFTSFIESEDGVDRLYEYSKKALKEQNFSEKTDEEFEKIFRHISFINYKLLEQYIPEEN